MQFFKSLIFSALVICCALVEIQADTPLNSDLQESQTNNIQSNDVQGVPSQLFAGGIYEKGCMAYNDKDWGRAVAAFVEFIHRYPNASMANDARFYLGISYFELSDYEQANKAFSAYLRDNCTPRYFEEALRYKFCIAEKFRMGACKHLFGFKKLPQWVSAEKEALDIYDEIATTLPNDDIAVLSLYSKAVLLLQMCNFRESAEEFQAVIRRFPRHPVAPASYLGVSCCYLKESSLEANNPDLLALAILNLKKFRNDFPGDPRIEVVEQQFCQIEELYASGFYEMAQFYERTEYFHAAYIYYATTVREFPGTSYARLAREKIEEWQILFGPKSPIRD
ncbi:MAG: outer membrane protein assembly factor BamD [Chlamydiales bacterium]|nr:outer membrane protein assembly factor BamD [Chlamydiales bacterium]